MSTAQSADEVWTLNCTELGAKTFTFSDAIAVTTAHVNDPDGANNSASTTLDVTVVPAATPTPTPTPPPFIQVQIDIMPRTFPNRINLNGNSTIPVAILTTPTFDATTVDPSSVCFGDAENPLQRDCTETHGRGHLTDVDGDGDIDLLLHYETKQTGIDRGDTQACLTGETYGGTPIQGCDSIVTVGGGSSQAAMGVLARHLMKWLGRLGWEMRNF
jgi:hypothetical protein